MKILNLWECKLKDNYTFTNDIEEVIRQIKNKIIFPNFYIKETFYPSNDITSMLDSIANKNNIILNYTNQEHLVAYSKNGYDCFINPQFFLKYKDEIKKAFKETILTSNDNFLIIPDWLFDDDLFLYIIKNKNITVTFKNIKLSDNQLQMLIENNIDAYLDIDNHKEKINNHDNFIFSFYTKEMLENTDELSFTSTYLQEKQLDNLDFLKDNSQINIVFDNKTNEIEYLQETKIILEKLNKLNKKLKVKIVVKKRSNFNKIINKTYPNLSLIIENDSYNYTYEEYKGEELKLGKMVANIKNQELSPLEKYLSVYNIVKNFKKYKNNENNSQEAKELRYILENEYIVCAGFSNLLVVLLDKIGISSKAISLDVDTSYDLGYTKDTKVISLVGHRRVILSIDDDKYNVHGLYIADPTWDNSLNNNYLNHALMTFDKMQIENRMFKFNEFDIILDIHDFQEFNEQVNFLLKRKLNYLKENYNKKNNLELLLDTYNIVCNNIIASLETEQYYDDLLNELEGCKIENDYINLLTKIGNYLLKRVNKKVDNKVILKASMEGFRKTHDMNQETINELDIKTTKEFKLYETMSFPYEIVDNNSHNLSEKKR